MVRASRPADIHPRGRLAPSTAAYVYTRRAPPPVWRGRASRGEHYIDSLRSVPRSSSSHCLATTTCNAAFIPYGFSLLVPHANSRCFLPELKPHARVPLVADGKQT